MQNWRLDDLLSAQLNNTNLAEGLKLIKQRATSGSLASYDKFKFAELIRFRQIYNLEVEDTITSAETFPSEMMFSENKDVALPDDPYKHLVEYYNAAYNELNFLSIAEASQNPGRSDRRIVVLPRIHQFGCIRIGAKIFGSVNAPRYMRSSFIRAKFVQTDGSVEVFPGQVQYYFEHEVILQKKGKLINWLMLNGSYISNKVPPTY